MEGSTGGAERDSVDLAHGCAVGRCSRPLSFLPNLPSQVSTMGSIWSDEESSGGSCVDLKARGVFDVREAFIDGSFAPAKKGTPRLAKQSAARVRKLWPLQTATVCPL